MKNRVDQPRPRPSGVPPSLTSGAPLPWTDFQLVLVISREGSVAKACGALGMTHATLLRKLALIESRLRTRVFERSRAGYALTAAGQVIVQAARDFEPHARAAVRQALGQDLQPSGDVRVSVASIVINHLLPPLLAQFAAAFPEVQIELTASREHASLRRREADVAIRIADAVPEWLVGRKLADVRFKVYGLRRARAKVMLRDVDELRGERRWIGFERDARDLKFDRWLETRVPDSSVVLRVDDFSHALAMVRAGLGIALLPAFLEDNVPDLQALTAPIKELQTPLWLITHPELRHTTRVQVMMRAFGPALANTVRAAKGSAPAGHAAS
ncbi:MAG: LysR family transcriptional regulator [Aquincola sp.]|nr:LysR family transcriptional regulator [Aquincola sp.]